FVQAAGNATALKVNPAAVTVTYTATAASRLYGAANPALTGTVGTTGLVNGDTLAAIATGTAAFATAATTTSNVGSYAVTGSGLSTISNANYT
ncbi:MBG domain-containing protein, partial [Acinetobacter baumannii]